MKLNSGETILSSASVCFINLLTKTRRSATPNIPAIGHIGTSVLTATASQFDWNQHIVKGTGNDIELGKTPLPLRERVARSAG
jgi:hypothetical protein